jgi:hypothetical protein
MTIENRTTISLADMRALVIPCECGTSTELPFSHGALAPLERNEFRCPACNRNIWSDARFAAFAVELIKAWSNGNPIRIVLQQHPEEKSAEPAKTISTT